MGEYYKIRLEDIYREMKDKTVTHRNIELDLFKLVLVIGMIAEHTFQLLYDGVILNGIIWKFSMYINAITFSGFLFAFGCATQLAYLRRAKDNVLRQKLLKNFFRLLLAFYISGFAYTILVSQDINAKEAIKILCLWRIPGYSEFLLSFAMLMPLIWFFYKQLNKFSQNSINLVSGGGGNTSIYNDTL